MAENPAAMQRRRSPGKPFRPGQSANPAGKPKGTRHRATMLAEQLLDGEAEAMIRTVIEKAKQGDRAARRDRPVHFTIPALNSAGDAARECSFAMTRLGDSFSRLRQPLTPEVYEALWDIIAEKLEDAGYAVRNSGTRQSGLDRSKRTPTSLFYLPCPAQQPDQSFFVDYNDENRAILDAEPWLRNTVIPFRQPPPEVHAVPTKRNQARVEEATENWRQSSAHEHVGNGRFFQYAVQLRAAGMDFFGLEAKLYEEVSYAGAQKNAASRYRRF